MRSFTPPRRRGTPLSFTGVTLEGKTLTHTFSGMTLVVAVKTMCDGCRDFVNAALDEFDAIEVVIVSATNDHDAEWAHARHQIIVAPEFMKQLDVRWPPFYVVIDAATSEVVTEGVVFGPSQVAQEIAPYVA